MESTHWNSITHSRWRKKPTTDGIQCGTDTKRISPIHTHTHERVLKWKIQSKCTTWLLAFEMVLGVFPCSRFSPNTFHNTKYCARSSVAVSLPHKWENTTIDSTMSLMTGTENQFLNAELKRYHCHRLFS